MLQAGIVGLPNVGKSTLFNALTAQEAALAANYPFATIEPNVGVVPVPDERLAPLAKIVKTETIIPATVEFVDIAGLVRGASKGEGLGNQFLANIRETDAVIQVVRCFEDENIIHVEGSVNPVRDIETIQIEYVPDDNSRILKLQGGEVDVIDFVPLSQLQSLGTQPTLKAQAFTIQQRIGTEQFLSQIVGEGKDGLEVLLTPADMERQIERVTLASVR